VHVDRRFLNWGVFLVAIGAVALATRQAMIPADVSWWQLWPLLLIGWGIGLILGRTGFGLVGGVLVAATLGVIVGGVVTGSGLGGITAGCGSGGGTAFPTQTGGFSAEPASVELTPGCGRLDVTAGGDRWTVAGSSPNGSAPEIDQSPDALTVRTPNRGFDWFGAGQDAWQVTLPATRTLDLAVSTNAGTSRLALANARLGSLSITANAGSTRADLSGTTLSSLSVTANAGDARIVLPAATMSGSLTANAGSVSLCVPAGTGIRISMSESFLGGDNFGDRGLTRSGDTWTSSDYATATNRIDLSATANAGGITLNPDGGCR